nr:telomere length regulation protein TEL2 homolog [Pogona vitticeps]
MDSDLSHTIQEAIGILNSCKDGIQISKTLCTVKSYLDGSNVSPKEKEEFIHSHFTPFLQCLICNLSPDWEEQFQENKQKELWLSFFLEGPAEQSFMVLLDSIISTEPSFRLNKVVDVLEQFLQQTGLSDLMWEVCKQQTQVGVPPLQEAILSRVVCLPDHLGNKLQERNRPIFFPQNYFPLLGTEIIRVLEKIFASLRGGLDCSISFVSQVLGKTCVHGKQQEILNVLVPQLTERTQSDCIWQRMCWRLVESVPDRWMEAVICGFVRVSARPAALSRLLGNVVVKSKKAQFVMTQKLLLLQYSYPTSVLQTLLGYLALDSTRRPLLNKILKELLETWGSSSAVKHSPAEQQLYISKAILICLSHLKEEEIMSSRQELLTSLMEGMKCHLDSNLPRIRHMGMVVGECVSARMMPEGPALKFAVNQRREKFLFMEKKYIPLDSVVLTGPEDADKWEATVSVLETLIRRNAAAAREASVELAKVLLHLEEKSYIASFAELRQGALVAVLVTDPVTVTRYLTSEFYSLNYSLRQRMDILDALAGAARELSRPLCLESKPLPSLKHPSIQVLSSDGSSPVWQKVVDERIKKKTRRFAKGPSHVEPSSAPNRFAPVAGHFFFPLLQNFDRPMTTFDLLGDDHLVLGRLLHTLAILMHCAANSGVATAMGKALLEFVWALRFHVDAYVRQGLLTSVSSTLLSVPAEHLLEDMTEELMETRFWLADVAEKDPDGDCRSLALQSLLLMENLKKKLETVPFS